MKETRVLSFCRYFVLSFPCVSESLYKKKTPLRTTTRKNTPRIYNIYIIQPNFVWTLFRRTVFTLMRYVYIYLLTSTTVYMCIYIYIYVKRITCAQVLRVYYVYNIIRFGVYSVHRTSAQSLTRNNNTKLRSLVCARVHVYYTHTWCVHGAFVEINR